MASGTQWRLAVGVGGAVWTGLDYVGVRAAATMMAIEIDADLFDRLRVLEHEALSSMNKRSKN